MTAPISNKSIAGGVGALTGGSVGVLVTDLLGQLPALNGANSNVLKALGGIIIVLLSMFGARWVSWAKKESDDFIQYAASESGKILVDAGTKLGVPQVDLTPLVQKIDEFGSKLDSKVEADAEKLLARYFSGTMTSTGAAPTVTLTSHAAPTAPAPSVVEPAPAAPSDSVLTDQYQPLATEQPDPVLTN